MPLRRTHRPATIWIAAATAVLLVQSAGAQESHYGKVFSSTITDRIARKECSGAVEDLKSGLKQGLPEVALLAGGMYDTGICVRRDWNRAVQFFGQAYNGGMLEAADRLAAGYAAPENGADVAAALWWANRGNGLTWAVEGLPGCKVSEAVVNDVDRFAAELQTWPQARLRACNYMVGVMSSLAAEVKYPSLALQYKVGGDVVVRFLPAVPSVELQQGQSREYLMVGWIDGDTTRARTTASMDGFQKAVSAVANRALRRYPRPDGLPADALVKVQYHFQIEAARD